jgi:hypothetical protein
MKIKFSMRNWGSLVLGICLVFEALPLRSAESGVDAKTTEVLELASAYYSGLQSFQADGHLILHADRTIEGASSSTETNSTFQIALSRPASFAFIKQTGVVGGVLVANGVTVSAYLETPGPYPAPVKKEYISLPAPAMLSDLITRLSG